jgi:alkylation response protein AidB-like acyl-CoA dehydrogenase
VTAAGGDGCAAYRDRVRAALRGLQEQAVDGWETDGHLPREAFAALADHGVFRDRWRDGAEGGLPYLVAMAEETARVSSGVALAAMAHSEVFIGALQWLAACDGQRSLLEAALDGRVVGCFAATESHGGSDLAGVRATARRILGGWYLAGRKRYVSNLGGATHLLVLAREPTRPPTHALSLFLVPLDAPGVRIDGFFATAGLRSCDVGEVSFDVVLGRDALLGASGMGLLYATRLLQFERISICAQLIEAARIALGLAAAHARRRTVFGSRLLDKQAVRHRLASCQAGLWAAEALLERVVAAALRDCGVGHQVAGLKLVTGRMAEQVIDECLQLFGARGYTSNYPLERIWRDARLARIGGGPDEVMAEVVASRLDRPSRQFDELLDRFEAADLPLPDRLPAQGSSARTLRARISPAS